MICTKKMQLRPIHKPYYIISSYFSRIRWLHKNISECYEVQEINRFYIIFQITWKFKQIKSDNLNSVKKSSKERKDRPHAHYCKELLTSNAGFIFLSFISAYVNQLSPQLQLLFCQIVEKRNCVQYLW